VALEGGQAVLVVGFPAAAFATNCYVVAAGPGEECLVVDPGVEVEGALEDVLTQHRLKPAAVLLTHGHLDHTFSVTPVCGARGIPAWIHPGDRELLVDPMKGLSAQTREFFGGRLEWAEPDDVRTLEDGAVLDIAGVNLTVDHAPGHTPGSVMFRTTADCEPLLLSGDVLFAGSIGRTDLPGGSMDAMLDSLSTKCLPLDDDTIVLPGHGESTTIGRERAMNPYLRQVAGAASASDFPSAVRRGL
jgi:glyoxylase-like metal-dependent hydrolase (beta-lactamase superfamily II)